MVVNVINANEIIGFHREVRSERWPYTSGGEIHYSDALNGCATDFHHNSYEIYIRLNRTNEHFATMDEVDNIIIHSLRQIGW